MVDEAPPSPSGRRGCLAAAPRKTCAAWLAIAIAQIVARRGRCRRQRARRAPPGRVLAGLARRSASRSTIAEARRRPRGRRRCDASGDARSRVQLPRPRETATTATRQGDDQCQQDEPAPGPCAKSRGRTRRRSQRRGLTACRAARIAANERVGRAVQRAPASAARRQPRAPSRGRHRSTGRRANPAVGPLRARSSRSSEARARIGAS